MKNKKKHTRGITLIALVVTIIVLLILAGISIAMLSGNNGILQRATDAKTMNEKSQIVEYGRTDVLEQITNNKGQMITKAQLATILNKYFKTTEITSIPDEVSETSDLVLTTLNEKYKINLSEIFKGSFQTNTETIGKKYDDSWIGKGVNYKSENNNIDEWIVIGKQMNEQGKNDILITTAYPVGGIGFELTYEEWLDYNQTLNTACLNCVGSTGTLGTTNVQAKEVRSITLKDINTAVGFTLPETFDEFTFGSIQNLEEKKVNYYYPDEENRTWINPITTGTFWNCYNNAYEYYYYGGDTDEYKYRSAQNGWNRITLSSSNLSRPKLLKFLTQPSSTGCWVATRSVSIENMWANFRSSYFRVSIWLGKVL